MEAHTETPRDRAELLALGEAEARKLIMEPMPGFQHGAHVTTDEGYKAWRAVLERVRGAGFRRLALYGAGAHTSWLLSSGLIGDGFEVVVVLDDEPRASEIGGVAIARPADGLARLDEKVAVLPSSDKFESVLLGRLEELLPDGMGRVFPVYETRRSAGGGADGGVSRVPVSMIEARSSARVALGLGEERAWVDRFAATFGSPDWANGFVNHRDTLLLWDLIEATRPSLIVEIGTASGVSAASIAGALDLFCDGGVVHTYDISSQCYFDASHRVGDAIKEVAPGLEGRVVVHPIATAANAAEDHPRHSVDLAFIDGEHRHPAPTLDLLTLLDTLKPGAWVALHDIELAAVLRSVGNLDPNPDSGAERLFNAWPFEKIKPDHELPEMNNVGAIRLPADRLDAVEVLLGLLLEPWENGQEMPEGLSRTLSAVRRGPARQRRDPSGA